MTKQATATATSTPKAPTWYGVSARDFATLVEAENDPVRLGHMLAYVRKRIGDLAIKHPTRVKRWEKNSDRIVAKLNGIPAQASAPALANAVTFTQDPLPKAAKAKKPKKSKASTDDFEARFARMEAMVEDLANIVLAKVTV